MQQNHIASFQEIINLGRLSTLKHLNLSENQLSAVHLPDCDPSLRLDIFENLIEINLRDNPIQDDVSILSVLLSYLNKTQNKF